MSTEMIHLITVSGLAVLAGAAGFFIGGCIEMWKYRRVHEMSRRCCGKNSDTLEPHA